MQILNKYSLSSVLTSICMNYLCMMYLGFKKINCRKVRRVFDNPRIVYLMSYFKIISIMLNIFKIKFLS
ncbi:hypothetical protein D0T23_21145 [Duganella sp. BJB475]|nr:hypothetical protein D0T23_21145 [Duganella sp. BJB475]RFP29741.1 hypothetical protein D0T21_17900 [Duganella sp. BJB476]